jgi:transposase-like protein
VAGEGRRGRPRNPQNPACARCGAPETVSKGVERGRQRWRCRVCGRTFGETLGTPLDRLQTDPAEVVRALRIVLGRGSLRAAEEQTGPNDETVAVWIKRLGDHAAALTDLLVRQLHPSEVELDELWSFVGRKGGVRRQRSKVVAGNLKAPANGGAA